MSKIDCNRGGGRASSRRRTVGAAAQTVDKLENQTFDHGEETSPSCDDAATRLAPIEKKRLIDLERRAQFQRLGGSLR